MPRGGRRPGAGRPRGSFRPGPRTDSVSTRVPSWVYNHLLASALQRGISLAALAAHLLEKAAIEDGARPWAKEEA